MTATTLRALVNATPTFEGPIADHNDERAKALRPLTIEELRARQAPRWLIRSILQRKAIALVWGASGSGKTFLLVDLVGALARNVKWFGKRTASCAGVAYVAGEGHLRMRIEAYLAHHQLSDDDLVNLRVVASNVNLFSAGADLLPLIGQLKHAAQEMGGVALVVLDTLNAMMPGGNENAPDDMGVMIAAARLIAEQLDCAVVYVHHCGKDESNGARGHSSLRAAVDTELVVRDTGGYRVVTVEKQRDGETGAEYSFRLLPIDLGPSEDPDADPDERETSCVVEPIGVATAPTRKKAQKRDVALDALHAAIAEHGEKMTASTTIPGGVKGVRLDRWQARFRLLSGDDYRTDDIASAAFRRARARLIEGNKAACSGSWAWPL